MSLTSRRDQVLIDTCSLANQLQHHDASASIRVFDIRATIKPASAPPPWYIAQHEAYQQAHIPGAVFIDWLTDIVDPHAEVKMSPPSPEAFGALMDQHGVTRNHRIVIYDDDGGHTAARLWWLCRLYGHEQVQLLDGGWHKWAAEGLPVSDQPPQFTPTQGYAPVPTPQWRTDADEVQAAIDHAHTCLIDCRSPALFRGEVTRGQRKGHIPSARNVPIRTLTQGPHQTWKSDEDLRTIFAEAGITPDQRLITYCNAGVSASVGLFALYMLGYPNIANYDGSWYDWERDPRHPIAAPGKHINSQPNACTGNPM